jgi:hypothetical protein
MRSTSNSHVIYHGPSELDGAPIIAIATGFNGKSVNPKTGSHLIQVWILCADIEPLDAILSGADHSICGACPMRGTATPKRVVNRTCYVVVGQAPFNIWRQWNRERPHSLSPRRITAVFAGRGVRLGAYGDPAAVPRRIWRAVTAKAAFWTGYTHQWRRCHPVFADWCMASCDSEADRIEARALGYRTFRTTNLNAFADRLSGEIVCPGSHEAGLRTTCDQCRVCSGTKGQGRMPDVVITMHGFAFPPK